MLPELELYKLAEDIKAKGQLLPITSYEGQILDGRNRYKACEIAGVDPRIEEYAGDDPLGLVASLNDHRRHDTENERAMVGARMANLKHGGTGANQHKRAESSMETSAPVITIERAAELSGSTPASIKRARPIVQSGIPELQDMVDSGEVSIRAGSEVAKLPKEKQRKAVSGGADGVKKAAKKAISNTPPKPKRKSTIPNEADIEKENQRILNNLKTSWAIAPKPIREKFLEWAESTKNTTNA
jgi:ParB-like chromosome segregation protein Spo0J